MFTPLHEAARITGGAIHRTHCNWCLALIGGACSCPDEQFRIVRAKPARKVRGR